MLRRELAFFLIQMALMYLFGTLANVYHSVFPIIIWMALAVLLGILWDRVNETGEAQVALRIQSKPRARIAAYICGVVAAAVAAKADTSLLNKHEFVMSLVGVQFFVPVGAVFLGGIVSTVYLWSLSILRIKLRPGDLYLMVSLSALSLAFSYLLFLRNEDFVLMAKDASVLKSLVQKAVSGRSTQLYGLAPILVLTPLVQLLGYAMGSWIVYWREVRSDRQAS